MGPSQANGYVQNVGDGAAPKGLQTLRKWTGDQILRLLQGDFWGLQRCEAKLTDWEVAGGELRGRLRGRIE